MEKFFRVIIPTFGGRNYDESVNSVLKQTCNDYQLYVVHDDANSGNYYIVDEVIHINCPERRYNGGVRNYAMETADRLNALYVRPMERYTLFLDDDDIFLDKDIFKDLKETIEANNYPDLIRLPYGKLYVEENRTVVKMLKNEIDISTIAESSKVAPWTKCIKTDLFQPFPENTLHEDVIQHLKQCDVCQTVVRFDRPVVQWRQYAKQTSKAIEPKWNSDDWRFVADLMELTDLKHSYCQKRRDEKIRQAKADILKKYYQQ